jgi:hypothetical protein
MKNVLMFYIIGIQCLYGYCQIISNCNVASELREAYDWDVSQLALNRIYETNSLYKDSIAVPEIIKDTIWEGLASIFNAYDIPERDSVFDIYCIHDYNCIGPMQKVHVTIDTLEDWTYHWKNHEIRTEYKELDDFLLKYNFQLWAFWPEIYLETTTYINLKVFIDSLKKFEGIIDAFNGGLTCCDNEIFYEKTYNAKYFTFDLSFVYGQFFCPNDYIWKFKVDNECNVELIESKHIINDPDQVLSEVEIKNCHITSGSKKAIYDNYNQFIISPNPTYDYIKIKSKSFDHFYITIYDTQGKILRTDYFEQEIEISLKENKPGLYFINIYNEKSQLYNVYKIIKK